MMDAGTKKSDTGYDVGDDLSCAGVAVEMHADIDERCRTYCDQHMGPQAAAALPVLSLGADQGAEDRRRRRLTGEEFEEVADCERVEESHDPPS